MDNVKAFITRLPDKLWMRLKRHTLRENKSMNKIIIEAVSIYLEEYKKNNKKSLTKHDTMVS